VDRNLTECYAFSTLIKIFILTKIIEPADALSAARINKFQILCICVKSFN